MSLRCWARVELDDALLVEALLGQHTLCFDILLETGSIDSFEGLHHLIVVRTVLAELLLDLTEGSLAEVSSIWLDCLAIGLILPWGDLLLEAIHCIAQIISRSGRTKVTPSPAR